jgi:hypothetical protein
VKIQIAERLKPFSHVPGTFCMLPKSPFSVQVFPTLLCFENLINQDKSECKLDIQGPLKDFTIIVDLEKARLEVFGKSKDGFVRYFITYQKEGIILFFEKTPAKGILCSFSKNETTLKSKQQMLLPLISGAPIDPIGERLSLGMHKLQDFSMIARRGDLSEIFPHWLRLSEMIPHTKESKSEACNLFLLKECERHILEKNRVEIAGAFLQLFSSGMEGILVPRLKDKLHQGIVPDSEIPDLLSSLFLLKKSAFLIRSLFFTEAKPGFALLPALPPEFHAGRFVNIQTKNGERIDLEWSKKLLRRVVIHSLQPRTIELDLQSQVKSFRFRRSYKDKGVRMKKDDPIALEKNAVVFIDCIEK